MMSLTEPTTKWPIDIELLGFSLKGDIYNFLFGVCTVLYIPMMGVAFYYFIKGILESVKAKNYKAGLPSLLVVIISVAALYFFNYWVFHEIF